MRYLEPLIGFLACLWFLMGTLLEGKSLRVWQQKAQALLGLSGILFFGFLLYDASQEGHVRYLRLFSWSKAFLAGVSIGIFITLWLEGSLNLLKVVRQRFRHAPNHTT